MREVTRRTKVQKLLYTERADEGGSIGSKYRVRSKKIAGLSLHSGNGEDRRGLEGGHGYVTR